MSLQDVFEPDLVEAFILARGTLQLISRIESEPESRGLALKALEAISPIMGEGRYSL